jgi:hypothetical protein
VSIEAVIPPRILSAPYRHISAQRKVAGGDGMGLSDQLWAGGSDDRPVGVGLAGGSRETLR